MKAIILAAGYATRLYPLTKDRPKALLPINNKPTIDYILDEIATISAVSEVFVVSNHRFAQHFNDWQKELSCPKPVKVLDDGSTCEEDRLGAIGDIIFALDKEQINEDVLIIAGDNFFTYRLLDFYGYFRQTDRDCVCVKELNDQEKLKQFAVARLDEQNKILELVEKPAQPKSKIAVYATYIYKKETLPLFKEYIVAGQKDAPGYFLQWLHSRKDVRAYKFEGECYDIGTIQAYNEVRELMEK